MVAVYSWNSWCSDSLGAIDVIQPLVAEASTRHYYRLTYAQGRKTAILMDASELKVAAKAHLRLTESLFASKVRVPEVLGSELEQGWLLLEDFGNTTLYEKAARGDQASVLKQAVDVLLNWQAWGRQWGSASTLPFFSPPLLERKLRLFHEHFLGDLVSGAETDACQVIYERLVDQINTQPQEILHRDYHSRNLMCLDSGELGVIDFQDAHQGPLAYDLVSLLKDAYVDWPKESCESLTRYFHERSDVSVSYDAFLESFDWLGIGRHLKCLGLFSVLVNEHGKTQYAAYIPRLLRYLLTMADHYDELKPLKAVLQRALDKKEL